MTLRGAYTNRKVIGEKTVYHQGEMARLEGLIFDMLGREVKLNSPVAMGKVLYQDLGIPEAPYAESKTMTDKESLYWNLDKHPVIPLFIEWKKFATRYKLYDKPYAGLLRNDTGMMHSALKPLADTGRFTSSGPNLQQLAKRGDGIEVREMFLPPPGYDYIMAWDMSQVELVLAGHRSRSPVLMAAYGEVRGDVHTTTCCNMFDITAEEAKRNKLYRTAGKTANFSLLYGGRARRIYRLIKLELAKMGLPMPFSLRDVEAMITRYFQQYPEIRTMQQEDKQYARNNGYVKSLFGRKFHLPDINTRVSWKRSKQERKATNSPIQGTCAELLKRAIIRIDNERIPEEDALMWASIHDENVFYVRKEAAKDVAMVVHKHMRDTPPGLRCRMESEGTIGYDFANQTDILLPDYSFNL
jgi:DNA polymerase-1